MSRGREWTRSVVGVYWISSMRSLRKTTLPGVMARFLPTAKAEASLMVMRPWRVSVSRLFSPWARLLPWVSRAFFRTSGLVVGKLAGDRASAYWRVR